MYDVASTISSIACVPTRSWARGWKWGRLCSDMPPLSGELFMVFEYLEWSLSDAWHRAQKFLDLHVVRRYSAHAAVGLAYLHSMSVAHRDVSKSNMLIAARNDVLKLADLGLAVSATCFVIERNVTALWYRAPEVLLTWSRSAKATSAVTYDPLAIDRWSLGVVIASMFCATTLFHTTHQMGADTEDEVIAMVQAHINFLGPPGTAHGSVAAPWPGAIDLPNWSRFRGRLNLTVSAAWSEPVSVLTGRSQIVASTKVRRPLPVGSAGVDLILKLLRWDPADRAHVADVVGHAALYQEGLDVKCTDGPRVGDVLKQRSSPSVASPDTPGGLVGMSELTAVHCECPGNCGNATCSAAKARYYRRIKVDDVGATPIGRRFCDRDRSANRRGMSTVTQWLLRRQLRPRPKRP
jgi:cyclin-dependent kinase